MTIIILRIAFDSLLNSPKTLSDILVHRGIRPSRSRGIMSFVHRGIISSRSRGIM